MQVFKGQHDWLGARTSHNPIGKRSQLPVAQLLGRQNWPAFRRERNVEERREQGNVLDRIELDQR
jgi:hypothetical protein